MSTDIFLCNICKTDRSFNKFPEYFRHITLYHANEPNFKLTCNLSDSCGVMYKTFTAYKTHVHRYHKVLLNSSFEQRGNNDTDDINQLSFLQPDTTADCSTIYDNNEDNIIYTDLMDDNPDDKWNIFKTNNSFDDGKINLNTVHQQYTRFLLEMREEHILPQTVIQSITTHIVNLFDIIIELVEEQAKQENLAEQQPTAASISIDGLRKTIKKIGQAITLSTRNEYQFLQSCKKFFDYSSPVENILSSNQSKNEQSYYIPIKHSLKKILQKDEMIPLLVENIRSQAALNHSDRDLMFSFRDGIKGEKINKQSFLIQFRERRDCPDPYFFPEPGPDPVGVGTRIGTDDVTGPGLKIPTAASTGSGSGRVTSFRDLANYILLKCNFFFIQKFNIIFRKNKTKTHVYTCHEKQCS
ncbi:unnamed protein product [Adineta steineri]|uniref:C2H2-type domain-containing protein n=1 Tax=Adineta steineri TaxID=433720 RepID=A0A819PTS0_9BILA|nr:unnamed protein product [Adineta steineri]